MLTRQPLANFWPLVVILLGFTAMAMVLGVAVGSGNLVLTGVVASAILGVALLSALEVVVWMILAGTLLIIGPLAFFQPALARLGWAFSMLGFFLAAASVLYLGTDRSQRRNSLPSFLVAATCFVVYSVAVMTISAGSTDEAFSGVKRYFQFWGLGFIMAAVAFKASTVKLWLRFLVMVAAVQLPFAFYQYKVWVPQRFNLPMNVIPDDVVAGTFEAMMYGGGNSAGMGFFLVLVLAGLVSAYRERLIPLRKLLLLAAVIGAPLTIGEAKIVVVMLPLALLSIYSDLIRKRPIVFLGGATLVIAFSLALGVAYLGGAAGNQGGGTLERRIQLALDYNVGTVGYFGGTSLNRTTVYPYWWRYHGASDPIGTLVGHGLGSSATAGLGSGHMDRKHPGAAIGLTGVSALLWDVGVIGTIGYFVILFLAWKASNRAAARAPPGSTRALLGTLRASFLMFAVYLFHSDSVMNFSSVQVLQWFAMGLLAWTLRNEGTANGIRI